MGINGESAFTLPLASLRSPPSLACTPPIPTPALYRCIARCRAACCNRVGQCRMSPAPATGGDNAKSHVFNTTDVLFHFLPQPSTATLQPLNIPLTISASAWYLTDIAQPNLVINGGTQARSSQCLLDLARRTNARLIATLHNTILPYTRFRPIEVASLLSPSTSSHDLVLACQDRQLGINAPPTAFQADRFDSGK